ncbi:site-specific integrase [Flavobacterium daejeonense]|uniref:site-specific integrase n=1 Tax=Flavobacterium daejeonense TaxID=350893 RepID=UPI00047AEFF2|nr:site-specific integrase [Flavobacterium daejeonense]
MLKVIFYIKTEKANAHGLSPIIAKISFKQQSITMSTGKSISKERWQFTNKLRGVLKLEKEKVIKQSLDIFQMNIEKKFNELAKIDSDVSLSLLKNEVKGKVIIKSKSISIVEIIQKHNAYFKKKVDAGERAEASLQKYERAKDLIVLFMKKQYGINNIDATEINSAFVYNLEAYLKYESNYKGKIGIKNNSVVKYLRIYKTACNYCIKMGILDKNPFIVYDGKLNIKDAVFLTQQELSSIENKAIFNERLKKVRDIFLFSCYTGYAPVDASNLTKENLFEDTNNDLWILTNRAKTAIKANVPLLPPALKIINKYKDLQDGLIPSISNQKMNAYLKEIADICGINKNLTWYVARHTFATTVTLGNGVRIENLSAMMGHTNIRQTQHYAKVLDVNVKEDMKKLKARFS